MAILYGTEELNNSERRTLTFQATHDGAGNRLPLMNRSFLSFSFGGKFIEDFLLIVTYNLYVTKGIYSEFEDAISSYSTIDGDYYWGTRMSSNHFNFTLSTDYMTLNMLDNFKHWFRPGVERDLILAEHPNRYIRARVAAAPQMSLTPFGEIATVKIQKYNENNENSNEYKTMTTIYRGNIEIEFIADEPYWTGILNYMPYTILNIKDETNERLKLLLNLIITNNSLTNADALKICLEDGIPNDIALYGTNNYFLGVMLPYSNIILSRAPYAYSIDETPIYSENSENTSHYPEEEWAKTEYSTLSLLPPGAYVRTAEVGDPNTATIYNYILNNTTGLNLNNDNPQYLFYSGTAPCKPIVKFTLDLVINNEGYIIRPFSKIVNGDNFQEKSYIAIGDNKFEFTTPGICTAYNKMLEIVDTIKSEATIFELLKEFREKIKNKYVRKWGIYCLKDYNSYDYVASNIKNIKNLLVKFFNKNVKYAYDYDNLTRILTIYTTADFNLNFKTGELKGTFSCHKLEEEMTFESITENVGDMALSNYLIIDKRNYLNENGVVVLENCTPITTNENISNLIILYDNMYY